MIFPIVLWWKKFVDGLVSHLGSHLGVCLSVLPFCFLSRFLCNDTWWYDSIVEIYLFIFPLFSFSGSSSICVACDCRDVCRNWVEFSNIRGVVLEL